MITSDLDEYNERLHERDIRAYDVTILQDIERNNPKFESNGTIKSFYGTTCITWIDQQSELFQKLCELQKRFQQEFEQAGLGDIFAFLEPESFHMTICDIEASSDPAHIQLDTRIEQVQGAFEQVGKPGCVTSQVQGIGLKRTITALVRFTSAQELKKILDIEQTIKGATDTNVRSFVGHISLAYFVQYPGESIRAIKDVLLSYDRKCLGAFVFSQIDLTCFTNMNRFIPLLTINLTDGTIIHHDSSLKNLTEVRFGREFLF